MKKIKVISMILTFVIIVTSCNLGMMFTSDAAGVRTITLNEINIGYFSGGLKTQIENAKGNYDEVVVNINFDFDCSAITTFNSIDAGGLKVTVNGNNHVIKNLHINGRGLFSNMGEGSSFNNLGLYNCYITDFAAENKVGYGFLAGVMPSGTISNCFVDGTVSVYGTVSENNVAPSFIGGLVGSFGGTMTNSYSMVDIYTNGSYVGGLIGSFTESETITNSVTKCYSTGSIDNDSRDYIGGLIGRSVTPCITNSYTSTCILNPYADTVKSIGVISGLSADDNVYYDENISLQRQGDMDPHRATPSEISTNLKENDGWDTVDGFYPQLTVFCTDAESEAISRISAISAAIVDVSREDGITTGREFTVVSDGDGYSFATLTTHDSKSTAVLPDVNNIEWRITGGVDEYYFDPTDLSNFPTNSGSTVDGLSGNTYDVNTGKYLFVNTGDIKFTAYSGAYERDIYVHVTTADKNPYIQGGTGTETDPFIINNYDEFDMIRVYCLDDEVGGADGYHYNLSFASVDSGDNNHSPWNLFDFSSVESWMPILGMKGTLNGNGTVIRGMKVSQANEGSIGLFATISNTASISDIHISEATVKPVKTNSDGAVILADNGGLLAGSVKNATIKNVIATGVLENVKNGGMIAGEAYGNTKADSCLTYGLVSSSYSAGGIFGMTEDNVLAIHSYSSAVLTDAENVGGFFAVGAGDVEDSVFTGNISVALGGVKHGLVDSGTVTKSYFDWQAAGIHNSDLEYALTTAELVTSGNQKIELNTEYWGWYEARGVIHYPQLKCFADDNYTGKSTYTSRTSNLAAFSFAYTNSLAPDQASSISFDSIDVTRFFEVGVSRTITVLQPYGADSGGYILTPSSPSPQQNYTVSVSTGGKQIYSFNTSFPAFPCDTRFVMFNVKNIKVYYKFAYDSDDDKTEYNTDMYSKGLTAVTNGLNVKYNLFLDSTSTDNFDKFESFVHAGESLNFKMTQAAKYNYTIEVYSDEACTNPVPIDSSVTGDLISTEDLEKVYVVFNIKPKELPWGIYRLTSN